MQHARMIRQFHQKFFKDSRALELVSKGLISRRSLGRQSICIKYLGLVIIGILAMEPPQSIRIGMHALSVVKLVGVFVEHGDGLYVIVLAWCFPADGLGFCDCGFPL